jgi:hypothetical protein
MQHFKASTQYGDWEGTAAADGNNEWSVEEYLDNKGLMNPNESVISVSLSVLEGSVYVRAFLFQGKDSDSIKQVLANISGPIPVREVPLEMTLEEFARLFKRFSVSLTYDSLHIDGRAYLEQAK